MENLAGKIVKTGRITKHGIEALVPDEKERAELVNIGFGKATKKWTYHMGLEGAAIGLETTIETFSSVPEAKGDTDAEWEACKKRVARSFAKYYGSTIKAVNTFLEENDLYLTGIDNVVILKDSRGQYGGEEIVGEFYSPRRRG